VTVDAVRGRIRRGTLDSEREGGTVYVYVEADPSDRRGPSETVEGPSPAHPLVEELRDRIRYLERQVEEEKEARRRADMLLAQLVSRVPELEAPQERQESPREHAEASGGVEAGSERTEAQEGARRPWWRRMFGG
jgi:TolA-binding protein